MDLKTVSVSRIERKELPPARGFRRMEPLVSRLFSKKVSDAELNLVYRESERKAKNGKSYI
ncbi:MAG: hypothetical protein V1909_05435, partial [Candidatus Micrarchaeota archaeon]